MLEAVDVDRVGALKDLRLGQQNFVYALHGGQSLGDVVACLGDFLQRIDDRIEDDEIVCDRQQQCVTSIVYKKINDAISGVVDNITLQDLVDWQNEKNGNYVI